MDSGQLHRLGKRLVEVSRSVASQPGDPPMNPGELAVLEDVLANPDSTISDIATRTGFVQGHVSTSVGRLRERGVVESAPDPADGRRTLVRVAEPAAQAIVRRSGRSVDDAVLAAIGDADRAGRAVRLLDELAELLLRDA